MATYVKCNGRFGEYISFSVFGGFDFLWVVRFKEGIVTVHPGAGCNLSEFAYYIEGCFDLTSNFKKELRKALNLPENEPIEGIKCLFNDIHICTATQKCCKREWIISKWRQHFEH